MEFLPSKKIKLENGAESKVEVKVEENCGQQKKRGRPQPNSTPKYR